jgi:hypothetical protein
MDFKPRAIEPKSQPLNDEPKPSPTVVAKKPVTVPPPHALAGKKPNPLRITSRDEGMGLHPLEDLDLQLLGFKKDIEDVKVALMETKVKIAVCLSAQEQSINRLERLARTLAILPKSRVTKGSGDQQREEVVEHTNEILDAVERPENEATPQSAGKR